MIVAFSGLTYFIAELWNREVNIITIAFNPMSMKNLWLTTLLNEMELDSKISASGKNVTKFVACWMNVKCIGFTTCENLFCNAINSEKQMALHKANKSPGFICKPFPEQVIRYIPTIDINANTIVFEFGHFFSNIAMIIGVITIESCTIKAVFDPDVRFKASMQKVLLAIETRLISAHIKTDFLLKLFRCSLNKTKVTAKPSIEQMKRIENGGKKFSSILDQMYEEPQNRAFSNKKI